MLPDDISNYDLNVYQDRVLIRSTYNTNSVIHCLHFIDKANTLYY